MILMSHVKRRLNMIERRNVKRRRGPYYYIIDYVEAIEAMSCVKEEL